MDEPFVDFYQILGLPLDADRDTLRKRINELYLDAQGNLDHRQFATRLKYQELFEATLPQARFVLLDDTRRAEYSVLVRAFRAPLEALPDVLPGASLPPLQVPPLPLPRRSVSQSQDPGADPGAPLSRDAQRRLDEARRYEAGRRDSEGRDNEASFEGRGAEIEPLPTARPSAQQLEAQRQELWNKWKAGLEEALAQGSGNANNSLTRASPTQNREAQNQEFSNREAPDSEAKQKEALSRQREYQRLRAEEAAASAAVETNQGQADSDELFAARRSQHQRDVTREVLVNVGLVWSCVGALLVAVPGVIALVTLMGRNFPRGGRTLLSANPNVLWACGFIIITLGALGAAQAFSRAMRRHVAMQLALLPYEDLLRRYGGPNR